MCNIFLCSLPAFFAIVALSGCIGALTFNLWIAPNLLPEKIWRFVFICLIVMVFAVILDIIQRSVEMSGESLFNMWSIIPTVLMNTHSGKMCLIYCTSLIGLWICWWKRIPTIMLGLCIVISFVISASGHGGDGGNIQLFSDWLHILFAGAWGGGLITYALVFFPVNNFQLAGRFSLFAGYSLGIVFITGVYNAWIQIGSFSALWETNYGITLSIKLLLFFVIVFLGALNRYMNIPKNNVRLLERNIIIEAIVILLIFYCSAILGHENPREIYE